MKRNTANWLVAVAACIPVATACAAPLTVYQLLHPWLPTPILLLGEQHDAPEHQALQRELVQHLTTRDQLAAVVMEMLPQGLQTTGLPTNADEPSVRNTLQWTQEHNNGWPWSVYGPVVMAAVRAGVPVVGGNLPRERMRSVMADTTLDARLPETALREQRSAIRSGHCDLLPESQIAPMTRIQIARDISMARTTQAHLSPGKTVLLIAGNGHVRRDLGVPQHLPPDQAHRVLMVQAGATHNTAVPTQSDVVWPTPPLPPQDHCASLKKQMGR